VNEDEAEREINRLAALEYDWDGDGAEPPDERALVYTRQAVRYAFRIGFAPSGMMSAYSEGGVSVSFARPGITARLGILNEGAVHTTAAAGRGKADIREHPLTPSAIKDAVALLQAFAVAASPLAADAR
jgi:hypothetical protein